MVEGIFEILKEIQPDMGEVGVIDLKPVYNFSKLRNSSANIPDNDD